MQQKYKIAQLTTYFEDKKITSQDFILRMGANFPIIYDLFLELYPNREDKIETLLKMLYQYNQKRSLALKAKDYERIKDSDWYCSEKVVGMMLYLDHFTEDFKSLTNKLDYFQSLGINLLHIMPFLDVPEKENDGGYAVRDYKKINPTLGNFKQWNVFSKKAQELGIDIMMDFVLNHCSDEHQWALNAQKGDPQYQKYFYIYPDRVLPNEFEKHKLDIFPQTAPGDFTYNETMKQWVMTLFHRYQWDLNYKNPEVFLKMLEYLLYWANKGVSIFRLDAVAYMWKEIGVESKNLPQVHTLLQLFKLCGQSVAPGVAYVAEAIVAPDEIIKYFGQNLAQADECDIAYNANFMALTWEALATKNTRLLYKSIEAVAQKPTHTTWINYARCHDDIGLGFDNHLIYEMGYDAKKHRAFLIDYYCHGKYNSYAKGEKFMYNPQTGDARISGSLASLCGLEKALEENNSKEIELALKRINLQHSLVLSLGGIPMLYSGDEWAMLNDYSYKEEESKKDDNRWMHRPKMNWNKKWNKEAEQINETLKHLISLRKQYNFFKDTNDFSIVATENSHLFIFNRENKEELLTVVCNFSDYDTIWEPKGIEHYRLKGINCINGQKIDLSHPVFIGAYDFLWII